ncbi:hypothetical protein GGI12_002081 [Dipsacomyces acuminosporus]|nr:hypothetical protein GGI12_002081 [Dipsacomyces acuminosporus]
MAPSTPKVLEYSDEKHAEVMDDLIIGDFGYKYRILDGVCMPPYVTPKRYELSRTIKTNDTDICFVSFPKSGSTWLSYILVLLTGNKGSTLRDSLHWVESSWTYPRSKEDLENAKPPRIFKSHMPYQMALGGVPAENPCKYIYIARNPKDVCASYFHFESEKSWSGYYQGGWDHWFQMFVEGKVQRGDWFNHVVSWWEHRDCDNVLFLKYEDLKKNTGAELAKLAEFLGIELAPEDLERIKSEVGFSSMKSTEFSSLKDVKEFNTFFRKGQVGSWKEMFTVKQSELFDQLCKDRLPSDLTFDFD